MARSIMVQIRVTPEEKAAWKTAAGDDLSFWIRQACEYAAANPEAVKAFRDEGTDAITAELAALRGEGHAA